MGNKRVDAVVDLGMDAGKAAARPVVMHHEIVEAENVHMRGHKIRDGAHKRFIRLRAQQRVDGVLHYADARPQNKQRHQKPSPAVDHQPRQPPDHAGKQHRAGRDHVAAAVGRGGGQRGGADLLPSFRSNSAIQSFSRIEPVSTAAVRTENSTASGCRIF